MKKKQLICAACVLATALIMTACSGSGSSTAPAGQNSEAASSAAPASSIKYLRMASGTQGASWFPIGSAMMDLVGKDLNGISTSNGPGGSVANAKQIQAGEFELGWMFTSTSYDAYTGVGTFADAGKQDKLRHLISLFPSYTHLVVREDSPIQSLEEVGNKMVNYTPATEGNYSVMTAIMGAYGFNKETLEKNGGALLEVRFNEASELIKNNQLDLWTATLSIPASAVSDMAFQPGIRFLQFDGEKRDQALANLPGYTAMTIPGGVYEGVTDPVETIGSITQVCVSSDVPDEVVYQMLNTFYDHWTEIQEINPTALGGVTVDDWLAGNSIPIHPGAEKFYKEKGLLK